MPSSLLKTLTLLALTAAPAVTAKCYVEQVHLAGGLDPSNSMTVTWSTNSPGCSTEVLFGKTPESLGYSAKSLKTPHSYTMEEEKGLYISGYIRHVSLENLEPSTRYFYKCGESLQTSSFVTAPVKGTGYPLNVAVVGDLGQTKNSMLTVQNMADQDPDLILHAGDMAYADCDQSRWDYWFKMTEYLGAEKPWYVCTGNHEIETEVLGKGEVFKSYSARYKMPYVLEEIREPSPEVTECAPSAFLGTYDYGNSFYTFVHGPMQVIFLNSYSYSGPESRQYKWLLETFEAVDREVTPWLFVVFHSPLYNSNTDHQGEKQVKLMKESMEHLFTENSVNMIFAGHVHAYERTHPVLKEEVSEKSPVYILIGDGGNNEGFAGEYLTEEQPSWSAFRDNENFGHGKLVLHNETHAKFEWEKNNKGEGGVVGDEVLLENQYFF